MSQEGIEIHFDEKHGYLELACEPDAFAPYREIARGQLEDFPEIQIDKVITINITDTAKIVANRNKPNQRIINIIFVLLVTVVLTLAVIGAVAIITRISA